MLWNLFQQASVGTHSDKFLKQNEDLIKKLYVCILEKVCNASFNSEFRYYHRKYLNRNSSEERLNLNLRTELKATGFKKKRKKNMNTAKNEQGNSRKLRKIIASTEIIRKENVEKMAHEYETTNKTKPDASPKSTPGIKAAPAKKKLKEGEKLDIHAITAGIENNTRDYCQNFGSSSLISKKNVLSHILIIIIVVKYYCQLPDSCQIEYIYLIKIQMSKIMIFSLFL